MSNLFQSLTKPKPFPASALPPPPPLTEEPLATTDTDGDDSSSSASSLSSTGTVVPTSSQRAAPETHWSEYFSHEFYFVQEQREGGGKAKWHVYWCAPASVEGVKEKKESRPVLVLHHGAGSSAMSFAVCVREIRRLMPGIGILAVEAREHGSVVWNADGNVDNDLSIETLGKDMVTMLQLSAVQFEWPSLPGLMLIGHSLGGAVVTHVANSGLLGSTILGFAVLDVVEGSAIEALGHMQAYLASRPGTFPSLAAAVEWHIRSRTLRNPDSARASVPSLLLQDADGRWVWRTELSQTESYWENWFTGMSHKFLSGKGAKLLLLAGTDRLDKELMIGQMQGKFQMQVYPLAGHFLQEDQPDKVAETIVEFMKRNDRSALVLPPKVSDLLAQGKKV